MISICCMLTYMSASASSPAQGAMYAPLALKFVDNMRPFRCLTCHFRAPVLQITVNPKATGTSPKSQSNSQAGAIAGGTIGGVSVFLAIGAIAFIGSTAPTRTNSPTPIHWFFISDSRPRIELANDLDPIQPNTF